MDENLNLIVPEHRDLKYFIMTHPKTHAHGCHGHTCKYTDPSAKVVVCGNLSRGICEFHNTHCYFSDKIGYIGGVYPCFSNKYIKR